MEEHQQQQMLDLSSKRKKHTFQYCTCHLITLTIEKGIKELSLEYGPCPSVMSLNLDNNHLHTLNGVEQFSCLMQVVS